MKHTLLAITAITLSTMSASAFAECPKYLTAEQKIECIVTEGAGAYYTPPDNVTIAQVDQANGTKKK